MSSLTIRVIIFPGTVAVRHILLTPTLFIRTLFNRQRRDYSGIKRLASPMQCEENKKHSHKLTMQFGPVLPPTQEGNVPCTSSTGRPVTERLVLAMLFLLERMCMSLK